jgi:phosphoribosyl 1,2-cyclic phosphodiesterase
MKTTCLGSSSSGNCFVMEFSMGDGQKPVSLMVECGISYQVILKRATPYGIKLSDLSGCLITHSHKDHCAAALDLAKRGVQIYATKGTLDAVGVSGGWPLPYDKPTPIVNGIKVLAFKVRHDAPEPAGFIIKTPFETVIFAIDAKEWIDDVSEIKPDYLFIESNYDPALMQAEQRSLQRRASLTDMQKYKLNERIKRSHMSIDQTMVQISKIKTTNLKAIFLMHLSDRMSAPTLWKQRVTAMTGVPCYVCRKDVGIE